LYCLAIYIMNLRLSICILFVGMLTTSFKQDAFQSCSAFSMNFIKNQIILLPDSTNHSSIEKKVIFEKKINLTAPDLHDVQIVGEGSNAIIYTVGDNGILIKSMDGGFTWTIKETGINGDLYWVHFINAFTGMVYTNHGLAFQTFDGGTNWKPISSVMPPLFSLSDLATGNKITDVYWDINNRAYATINTPSGKGSIATSQNGISWRMASSFTAPGISCVQHGSNAYAGGIDGVLIKSINGGTNWQQLASGYTGNIDALYFTNDQYGVVLSLNTGLISITSDSGLSWSSPPELADVKMISMSIENDTGYALSVSGDLYSTVNGGQNWSRSDVSLPSVSGSYVYTTISVPDQQGHFYAGTNGGQVYAWDGSGWTQLASSGINLPSGSVKKIIPVGGNRLYILCAGSVYKTNARLQVNDPISVSAYSIEPGVIDLAFSDSLALNAIALTQGHIFTSLNARPWIDNSGNIIPVALYGIASGNFDTYAAGADGRLFLSSDGISWQLQKTASRYNFNDIAVSGNRAAAISSKGATICMQNNGSWLPGTVTIQEGASTIRATGNTYFAAGKGGKLFSSYDGNTWTVINSPVDSVTINKLAVNSSGIFMAIAVGENGTIIKSSDGTIWNVVY